MVVHDKHTSDRIPNLSFRWSIQTMSPDLRKCSANVVEIRDIRDTESGRTYVSLWYNIHVDNGDRASESCAYDFDKLPRDRVRPREQYTSGVLDRCSYDFQVVHSLPPRRDEFKCFAAIAIDVCLQQFRSCSAVVDEVVRNRFVESKPGGDAGRTRGENI